jgi:glycosyltransferase involved in cell wall biosynthesis
MNWSGITSKVLEQFRLRHDVILLHNLSKWVKYLYAPYIFECKLRRLRFQLDRHPLVARHYATQVKKAHDIVRPDIVFSVSTIPLAYLPPTIRTAFWTDAIMHDMIDFYWSSALFHRRTLEQGMRLDELALRNVGTSFYASEWAAEGARKFAPGSSERIFSVPFGANNIADLPRKAPRNLPSDIGAPIHFLFVGGDWNRKGGPDCVEAVNILRSLGHNVHLSVAGARPHPEDSCPDFIHQYGFLRRNNDKENATLQRLYEEAHFFILPSHAECAGIVFAEAASYGLPVIGRDVGGVGSMVVRDLNGILIGADDGPMALAEAVRPLLSDAERYRAMSAASLRLFADRLNWKTAVDRVTDILENSSR